MFHLKGKRCFPSTFPSRRLRSRTPLTFQFHLAWTHSEVRRDFLWCLNLPRVYIYSPLDALRTFNLASICSCLHSLKGEEDFFSCLKMHESAEGFLHYWCLRSPKDDEVFKTFNYCHRSPKNDGDFKTFNYCHRSPKNDGDFKTFNYEACNITLLLP